jgi:hypothetical protein
MRIDIGMKIQTLAELAAPDDRSLRFTPLGLSTGGRLKPQYAAEFQQKVIAGAELTAAVPEGTRNAFERLRTLHSYGVLCYEAFTISRDLASLVMEQAFRERFVSYFDGQIPLVRRVDGTKATVTVESFDGVYEAVARGGKYAKGGWMLELRSSRELMEFRASLTDLQEWARREGLLYGERNKRWEWVSRRIRNFVAHPGYHLTGPPDSASAIHDLAEIINRLWGMSTAGGRLYPAPVQRSAQVVGWSIDNSGRPSLTLLRSEQLEPFDHEGDWTFLVIRGVDGDEGLWDFDAQFERTNLPAEFLWGPGDKAAALSWLKGNAPDIDEVEYLDRLFALQVNDDKVYLPRRPEVALALPTYRQAGEWRLLRADFPNDALAHLRHIKDGRSCTMQPPEGCPVEELFVGDWRSMAAVLASHYRIASRVALVSVRVPLRWSVAPDIGAD